jgi:hypothetical protein
MKVKRVNDRKTLIKTPISCQRKNSWHFAFKYLAARVFTRKSKHSYSVSNGSHQRLSALLTVEKTNAWYITNFKNLEVCQSLLIYAGKYIILGYSRVYLSISPENRTSHDINCDNWWLYLLPSTIHSDGYMSCNTIKPLQINKGIINVSIQQGFNPHIGEN